MESRDVALTTAMCEILGPEKVLQGPAAERAYDCDAYVVDRSSPTAIVLPTSTEEVARVVNWCHRHEIPFTARGAGTGLSGGAMAALGGVVISTKRMNRILSVDPVNRTLRAQTGAANRALTEAAAPYGLHFAPDPSSGSVSTLGGNIAENAGGPHTLKYGVTAGHILEVTVVLVNGEVAVFGSELAGSPGPNFSTLIVGSEGTLGIVTEAAIKLTPTPRFVETSLIAFGGVSEATKTVAEIISSGILPAALEMIDHGILAALKAAFGLEFPPEARALLLVECDGDDKDRVANEMEQVEAISKDLGAISSRRAADEKSRKELWRARKQGVGAMGRIAPTVVTHDGVIPRGKLPEMLEFVYDVAARYGIGVANMFHAGDGNLHPCFYFDDRAEGIVENVVKAGEEIMLKCVELGGSATGEHGVGIEKVDLMEPMFGMEGLALQEDVKRIFNEGSLCNPCKILPNQKSCVEHRRRWRGTAW